MTLDIVQITQIALGALIFSGIAAIFKFTADIRRELRTMNSRMVARETWSIEHAKLDDTRNEFLRQAIASLRHDFERTKLHSHTEGAE